MNRSWKKSVATIAPAKTVYCPGRKFSKRKKPSSLVWVLIEILLLGDRLVRVTGIAPLARRFWRLNLSAHNSVKSLAQRRRATKQP